MRKSDGTPLGINVSSPGNEGSLGFNTGYVVASDGSWEMTRTDVGGGWRRDSGSKKWSQIIDPSKWSVPSKTSTAGNGLGIDDFCIAPSNSNIAYIFYFGRCFRSADKGNTYADTGLNGTTGLYASSNDQTGNRKNLQGKSKVDPTNAEIVYYGSPNNGVWQRLSGTWAQLSALPVSPEINYGDRTISVAVDNSSALVGSGATSRRSVVYFSINGMGIYKTTDGGVTASQIADGSQFASRTTTLSCTTNSTTTVTTASTANLWVGMRVSGTGIPAGAKIASITNSTTFVLSASATASATNTLTFSWYRGFGLCVGPDGTLWVYDDSGNIQNLWKSSNGGTSFTSVTTPGISPVTSMEYDPKLSTRIICVMGLSWIMRSEDSGATWITYQPGYYTTQTQNCPLVADAYAGGGMIMSACVPHPVNATCGVSTGYGPFQLQGLSPWPAQSSSNKLLYYEDSLGVETLVAGSVTFSPNDTYVGAFQDRAFIRFDAKGGAIVQTPAGQLLEGAQNADWAIDNHNFWVYRIVETAGGVDYSSSSSDDFKTFTRLPNLQIGTDRIAVSNSNQIVACTGRWPRYLRTSDNTWQPITATGYAEVDNVSTGWKALVSDKTTAGRFYMINSGINDATKRGCWRSDDGGVTWAKVGSPNFTGLDTNFGVQLKVANNGDLFCCCGSVNSPYTEDQFYPLFKSTDHGVTWTTLANVSEPQLICVGAGCPGKSTPYMLYYWGWYNDVGPAHYRSFDGGATFQSWSPDNWFDDPYCMDASPSTYGLVAIGYSGSGMRLSKYSYTMLLKGS